MYCRIYGQRADVQLTEKYSKAINIKYLHPGFPNYLRRIIFHSQVSCQHKQIITEAVEVFNYQLINSAAIFLQIYRASLCPSANAARYMSERNGGVTAR